MNPLPIILACYRRNRLASVLFVVLIAFAVALGVGVSAQERALRAGSAAAADRFDLVVAAPGSPTDLMLATVFLRPGAPELIPGETWAPLLNEPKAVFAAPLAFGDSFDGLPIVGTTPEFTRYLSAGDLEGEMFADTASAVAGFDVQLAIGDIFEPAHGHGPGTEDGAHEGEHLRVVGRLPRTGTPWDRALVVAVESVWATHGLSSGHAPGDAHVGPPFDASRLPGVPAVVVRPDSVASAYGLRAKYRTATTMAFFPAEVLVQIYALLGDARAIIAAIAAATQVLVILAILAAVMTLMNLLAPQFAVLRAIGAPRSYVFAVVFGYVAAIVVAGCALGLGLGWAMSAIVSRLFAAKTGIALVAHLGRHEFILAAAVALIGLALATLPALVLYRRPVIDQLSRRGAA